MGTGRAAADDDDTRACERELVYAIKFSPAGDAACSCRNKSFTVAVINTHTVASDLCGFVLVYTSSNFVSARTMASSCKSSVRRCRNQEFVFKMQSAWIQTASPRTGILGCGGRGISLLIMHYQTHVANRNSCSSSGI